jgi:tRNA modification GTPase
MPLALRLARLTGPRPAAVAVLRLWGDVSGALRTLGAREVPVGSWALRTLSDASGTAIDSGVVVRLRDDLADLMPHGAPLAVRALEQALTDAGATALDVEARDEATLRALWPAARSLIEARMLSALARAQSPRAVELLLAQPARWQGADECREITPRDARLNRLIDPPMVVIVGPANVGKSTLLNALAGRAVALAADEPGTTRDHVGALIDLGGVVARVVDTPGLRTTGDTVERRAQELALALVPAADLVVLVGDAGQSPPELPTIRIDGEILRVALRADLGLPAWAHDLAVAVGAPTSRMDDGGLAALTGLLRERLVPRADVESPEPWKFWGG